MSAVTLDAYKTVATWKYNIKYMDYVSIFVATVFEVPFCVLKKGCPNIFCHIYIVYYDIY